MYVVLLLFLGTTGIVDYTNYEDMKYAVSYLSYFPLTEWMILELPNRLDVFHQFEFFGLFSSAD
jgi:hypothetical protein